MEIYYRIYSKFDGQNSFKAIDVNKGYQVNNLIYASLLTESELKKFIEFAKEHKGYQLQAREVHTNKTIKINY
jgi:hypothetical protein